MTTKPQSETASHTPDASLYIGVIERNLSDRSKVYAVVIREAGGMPFVELDCISERHAYDLKSRMETAISLNTSISLIGRH